MKKAGAFSGINKALSGSLKFLCKRGVLILLLLLITVGPVLSTAAQAVKTPAADEKSLWQTMATLLEPVKKYAAGEDIVLVAPPPGDKVASAIDSLNNFNEAVLKDPRLAAILDDIVWDLIKSEEFSVSIARKQEILTGILRDERLARVLGDVIAEYLMDERLAGDIEFFFSVLFDLLKDEGMHYFIRDALAAVLEKPEMANTVNNIITASINLAYISGTEVVADLLSDKRLGETVNELVGAVLNSLPDLPDLAAGPLEDERLLAVAGDLVALIMEYGSDSVLEVLEDPRFSGAVGDLLARAVASTPLADIGADITGLTMSALAGGLEALEPGQMLPDLLNELLLDKVEFIDIPNVGLVPLPVLIVEAVPAVFAYAGWGDLTNQQKNQVINKINEFYGTTFPVGATGHAAIAEALVTVDYKNDTALSNYFLDSLNYIIDQSMAQAHEQTPEEYASSCSSILGPNVTNQRQNIASSIAEVPPDMIKKAFFIWLPLGVPGDKPGTVLLRSFGGMIEDAAALLTPEKLETLAMALEGAIRNVIGDFMEENREQVQDCLRNAITGLPWRQLAEGIRSEASTMEEASAIMVQRIMSHLPLADLAEFTRDTLENGELEEVIAELLASLPYREAADLLKTDERVIKTLNRAIPDFSLNKAAAIIRNDKRLVAAFADAITGFPVEAITEFLQDPYRAEMIGHTISRILLNLLADFVGENRMTGFIHEVIIDAINSIDQSPGTFIADSLAAFLDNSDFAGHLAGAIDEFNYGVNRELAELYKKVVPRFFTSFIWRHII